jgi:hypothetical protein
MRMHNGAHICASAINANVEMELEWWLVDAFDQFAVKVNQYDIIQGELTTLAIPLVDEEVLCIDLDTGMAIVVNDVGVLQHPDTIHQLLFLMREIGHETPLPVDLMPHLRTP